RMVADTHRHGNYSGTVNNAAVAIEGRFAACDSAQAEGRGRRARPSYFCIEREEPVDVLASDLCKPIRYFSGRSVRVDSVPAELDLLEDLPGAVASAAACALGHMGRMRHVH